LQHLLVRSACRCTASCSFLHMSLPCWHLVYGQTNWICCLCRRRCLCSQISHTCSLCYRCLCSRITHTCHLPFLCAVRFLSLNSCFPLQTLLCYQLCILEMCSQYQNDSRAGKPFCVQLHLNRFQQTRMDPLTLALQLTTLPPSSSAKGQAPALLSWPPFSACDSFKNLHFCVFF
jgi:hypothetical protein